MKFINVSFPFLLASTAAAASISNQFDEQVNQSKTLQLRGTISGRSQDWLDSNQLYISDSLTWSHQLKQKAGQFAASGTKGGTCAFPQITLGNGVHGQSVSIGMGTKMTTLPPTDQIFQGWEASSNVDLDTLTGMKKVGCGDSLVQPSGGKMGCYVSVCLYSLS
ncbi:hypothetical protein ACHAXN_004423 [Cyclotella atomus]|jgi:hypothetical protein